jgi:hypothetical protein
MDVPVLEWCKLFGSDDADKQPIHWKNVVTDEDAFRSELLSNLGIDRAAWNAFCLKQFWSDSRDNRNRDFVLESENICHARTYPPKCARL